MNTIDLYNSRVRNLMSQEYRRVSQKRQEYLNRKFELTKLMIDPDCKYIDYIRYDNERKSIDEELIHLGIELNVWDQARELCFNAADEIGS